MASWIQATHESNNRVILHQRLRGVAGIKNGRLPRLGMAIDEAQITFTRAGIEALKDELLSTREIQQCEVLGRGPHENEIVPLGIVKGEETAALDPEWVVQQVK